MPKINRAVVQSAAGLMSIDEVAGELGTNTLTVKRLIARGRLKSTRLGDQTSTNVFGNTRQLGVVQVLATDLARYVAAGAPDFTPPPMNTWFTVEPYARRFKEVAQAALVDACEDQKLDASEAMQLASDTLTPSQLKGNPQLNVKLRCTDAFKAVFSEQVGGDQPRYDADGVRGGFKSLGWLYVVCRLREISYRATRENSSFSMGPVQIGAAGLEAFYESPEVYEANCAAAMSALRECNAIGFRDMVRLGEDALAPVATVAYSLKFGGIALDDAKLCDAAF